MQIVDDTFSYVTSKVSTSDIKDGDILVLRCEDGPDYAVLTKVKEFVMAYRADHGLPPARIAVVGLDANDTFDVLDMGMLAKLPPTVRKELMQKLQKIEDADAVKPA